MYMVLPGITGKKATIKYKPKNEPRHAKMCLRAYAISKGLDQTAHLRRLVKTFALLDLLDAIELMNGETNPIKTLRMRRMMSIRTFCVRFSLDAA